MLNKCDETFGIPEVVNKASVLLLKLYGSNDDNKRMQQYIKKADSGVIISQDGFIITNHHVIEVQIK